MAKIPLGDFGNAIAQPRPQVQYVHGAFDKGGAELEDIGMIGIDFARKAQDDIDKTKVEEAVVKAKKLDTDLRLEMFQFEGNAALKRPDGKTLSDEYSGKLKSGLAEIAADLKNPNQLNAFQRIGSQIEGDLYSAAGAHQLRQFKAVRAETQGARISTAANRANLLWGDEKIRAESTAEIQATIDEMAVEQGWDKVVKEAKLLEAMSPLHAGIIQGMVDSDRMDLAKKYYEENTPTMSMAVRAKAMNLIEAGDFEKKTQDGASAIWAMSGGNATEALKLAREQFSGKEEDAVVTRIKTLDGEETTIRERDQRDAGDKAWGLYADGKRIPASLWASMDGRDKIAIQNARRAEANHAAAANKEAARDARDTSYFTLYENDDALIAARPAEITSLLKQGFTQTQVASLMRKKEKLANEAEEVSVSKRAVDGAFIKAGIGNKTAGDKATRGRIAAAIDDEIYAEQQQRGRALTREEKDKIINRQFVEVGSYYKQTGLFSTSTGTQKKKYYEVENKDSIVIPQADKDRIIKTFRDSGVMVTPERLRDYYMRELGK